MHLHRLVLAAVQDLRAACGRVGAAALPALRHLERAGRLGAADARGALAKEEAWLDAVRRAWESLQVRRLVDVRGVQRPAVASILVNTLCWFVRYVAAGRAQR